MIKLFALGLLLIAALMASIGCSDGDTDEVTATSDVGAPTATARVTGTMSPISSAHPANWIYWRSDIDLNAIKAVSPEAVVIDYSQDGDAWPGEMRSQ